MNKVWKWQRAARAAKGQAGMTLLEIMIVLAIIALVTAFLVGPRIIGAFGEAKEKTAQQMAKDFAYNAYVRWDANNPGKGCPANISELFKYVNKRDGKDPWGMPFTMVCGEGAPEGGFGVISNGPDKKKGTPDDIKSWEN